MQRGCPLGQSTTSASSSMAPPARATGNFFTIDSPTDDAHRFFLFGVVQDSKENNDTENNDNEKDEFVGLQLKPGYALADIAAPGGCVGE